MKRVLILVVSLFVLVCYAQPVFCASEVADRGILIGLDEAVSRSLKDSALIRQAEARLDKEKALLSAAKRSFLPTASTEIYTAAVTGDERAVIFWQSEIRLPLFEGGRLIHEARKKDIEVRKERFCLEKARHDVAYEVKLVYIGLLKERELTRLSQEWSAEAGRFLKAMKSLYEKELITRRELFHWDVLFYAARHELVKHKEAMDYSEALICELVAANENERIELEPLGKIRFENTEYEIILNDMRKNNPLYEITRLRIKEKEEEKKILSSERFPKVGLSARFNVAEDSYVDHSRFEAGIVGSWNIWDFGVLGKKIKAKEFEVMEAQEMAKIKARELENETRKLAGDLRVASARIGSLRSLLKERKEAYQNEKTRFISGLCGEGEVFEVFLGLVRAKMNLIEALSDYRFLKARIERVLAKGVS